MFRHLLILFLLAGWVRSSFGQTTQPAPAGWEQTVQKMAQSLVDGDETKSVASVDCYVRSFDSASTKQIADVVAHTSGATLIMAKAYLFPGGAIAADIGAAVAQSQLPDDLKKLLVPAEGDPTIKANATATRWAQGALSAANDDPIAVLVFVTGDGSQSSGADLQVFFVMLKGHSDTSRNYTVTQVVYGDSQQAAMTAAR